MPANKDRLYIALHVRSGTVKMPSGEDKLAPPTPSSLLSPHLNSRVI